MPAGDPAISSPNLKSLAAFFLKLGTIAFGGPAVHIAMMQENLVERRCWLSSNDFLDLLALSNLLPGPSSTELAIFIGYKLAGLRGLLLAGVCFILPAFLIVTVLAAVYVRFGSLPAIAGILYGIKPVVIAIILQALWRLARTAIKSRTLAIIGLLALAANVLGATPLAVLLGTAALAAVWFSIRNQKTNSITPSLLLPLATVATTTATPLTIFLVFLKLGCILFGSGYLLLVFLRSDLVLHHHWLTENQLLDSVAVGQVTPGPVFTTATFIGYLLDGSLGASVATVGIFLPAFVFVAIAGPLAGRIRQSTLAARILDALNVASLALMAVVTYQLARAAIIDLPTVVIAILSAVVLLTLQLNSAWLIPAGAVVGMILAGR
jgi:chromate transporter